MSLLDDRREETAVRLAPIADELTRRVRGESAQELWEELLERLDGAPCRHEQCWRFTLDLGGLVMLLAAADDPNVDPEIKWGWRRYNLVSGQRSVA